MKTITFTVLAGCITLALHSMAHPHPPGYDGYGERYLSADRRDYRLPFERHLGSRELSPGIGYYRPGYRLERLPPGHHHLVHRGRDYHYAEGNFFYRPGAYYEVVHPPHGARVPYLPAGYVRFHIGPRRYFYFNHTYFLRDHELRDYVVVREPAGAEAAIVAAAKAYGSDIYVYPAQEQSAGEQDRDYADCHIRSVEESGYDPDREGQNIYRLRDYRRGMIACLEGRGYRVR